MAPGYNTDLQSILNKAMSQLQSLSSGSEASGKSSQPEYVNSIFGLVQNGQEALEGNDEQKASLVIWTLKLQAMMTVLLLFKWI